MGSPLRSPLAAWRIQREIKGMEIQPQKRALSAFLPHEHQREEKKEERSSLRGTEEKVLPSLELRSCKEGRREKKKHLEAKNSPTFPQFSCAAQAREALPWPKSLCCVLGMFTSEFKLKIKGKTSVEKTQFIATGGEKVRFGIGMLGIAFNCSYDQNNHKNEEVI